MRERVRECERERLSSSIINQRIYIYRKYANQLLTDDDDDDDDDYDENIIIITIK